MKAFTALAVGDYILCYNLFTQLIVDKGAVEALAYYLGRARCALHMQQYKGVSANAVRVLSSDPYSAEAIVLLATAMFELIGNVNAAIINLRFCVTVVSPEDTHMCGQLLRRYSPIAQLLQVVESFLVAKSFGNAMATLRTLLQGSHAGTLARSAPLTSRVQVDLCVSGLRALCQVSQREADERVNEIN